MKPLRHIDRRREKVARHYFNPREAWWEVSDHAREEWSSDHRLLDEAGALGSGGWMDVDRSPAAARTLDRAHDRWFATAERAFATGEQHLHEEPAKRYYIGEAGVLAVIAQPDDGPRLVTSFRPTPPIAGNPVGASATRAYLKRAGAFERAAVRRVVRGASR